MNKYNAMSKGLRTIVDHWNNNVAVEFSYINNTMIAVHEPFTDIDLPNLKHEWIITSIVSTGM